MSSSQLLALGSKRGLGNLFLAGNPSAKKIEGLREDFRLFCFMATSSPSARNCKADLESLGNEKIQNKGWKQGLLQKLVLKIKDPGVCLFFLL